MLLISGIFFTRGQNYKLNSSNPINNDFPENFLIFCLKFPENFEFQSTKLPLSKELLAIVDIESSKD